MNNPITQLLAQAEAGLSDLGRRAVESVTVPLRAKGQEIAAEVTGTIKASLLAIAIKAGLGLFAVVMFIIALSYGLSALHADLALRFGPMEATLIMGGVFLGLAVVAVVVLLVWPSPKPPQPKAHPAPAVERVARDAEAVAAKVRRAADEARLEADGPARAAAAQPTAGAPASPLADMTSGLGAIAAVLGEAGFRREQAGLRAGLALAEQLKPMQIVALALIGGFVAGVRHGPRRR